MNKHEQIDNQLGDQIYYQVCNQINWDLVDLLTDGLVEEVGFRIHQEISDE